MAKAKLKATVVSVKGSTAKVTVQRQSRHPIYGKIRKVHKSYLADCTGFEINLEDEVVISETAPVSKRKNWKVIEIIKKQ